MATVKSKESLSLHEWYEAEKKNTPERQEFLRGKLDDAKRDFFHAFRVGFADMWLDSWEVARANGITDLEFLKALAVESNSALCESLDSFGVMDRPAHVVTADGGYRAGLRASLRRLRRVCEVEETEIPDSRTTEVYARWSERNPGPYTSPYQLEKGRMRSVGKQ